MYRILAFLLLFPALLTQAQTGPGGIGNTVTNGLWLMAGNVSGADGSAVSVWNDRSGNGNNALQASATLQPQFFSTSALNGQPVLRFDGTNDEMAVPDANILDGTAGITYYAVLRPSNINGSARGILGKRITFSVNVEYAYTWFFYTGNRLFHDIHTSNDRYNTSMVFSNNTNYLLAFDFDGSLPAAQRVKQYSAGTQIAVASEASTVLPNSNQEVAIGALNVGYGTYLGADFAELIHFNYSLDTLEHMFVQNYLSAKYNIPLAVNDLYDEDNPANGDHDFDVAGIGRINASFMLNNARGSGIVRMLNPAGLNDNEFLFWGHNGGVQEAVELADVPAGVDGRYERVWRVSEVNAAGTAVDIGAVDIQWDLTGASSVTASDLRLLVDTDNDGSFADETPISGAAAVGGNIYGFSGVTALANNLRFTLGTANIVQTPLPVQLLSFTAEATRQGSVELVWKTASEINNDFFTVERSADLRHWKEIIHVPGAGNSTVYQSYFATDEAPLQVFSYYRLKQTDFDGTTTYSHVETVAPPGKDAAAVVVYPNPVSNRLVIECSYFEMKGLQLFDITGRPVHVKTIEMNVDRAKAVIDMSGMPPGVYTLRTTTTARLIGKQ